MESIVRQIFYPKLSITARIIDKAWFEPFQALKYAFSSSIFRPERKKMNVENKICVSFG